MAKQPATMFYVRDWLTDEHLVKVSFQTKGIWIDLLAHLWLSETRGKTTANRRELRSMLGCSASELRRFFDENARHPFCDVSCENGVYTIENRRMVREEAQRAGTRERVSRHRDAKRNAQCNENVTPPLAVAVASAVTTAVTCTPHAPTGVQDWVNVAVGLTGRALPEPGDFRATCLADAKALFEHHGDTANAVLAPLKGATRYPSRLLADAVKAIGEPVSETVEEQAARIMGGAE